VLRPMLRRHWAAVGVIVGLAALAVANLAYARWSEPIALRPLQAQASADLADLIRTGPPTVRVRGGLYADLADVAPAGTVVTYPGSDLERAAVIAIAGADLVVDDTYDPTPADELVAALLQLPHHTGELWPEAAHQRYVVIASGEPRGAARFRVLSARDTLVVADEQTLADALAEVSP
jgi:hypothetical protein